MSGNIPVAAETGKSHTAETFLLPVTFFLSPDSQPEVILLLSHCREMSGNIPVAAQTGKSHTAETFLLPVTFFLSPRFLSLGN
jgi:hypothetical protein